MENPNFVEFEMHNPNNLNSQRINLFHSPGLIPGESRDEQQNGGRDPWKLLFLAEFDLISSDRGMYGGLDGGVPIPGPS